MKFPAPLIITPFVEQNLAKLRVEAAKMPIDMKQRVETIKTNAGMADHMRQMRAQTITISGRFPFSVSFSIESGYPVGTCRHMSVSIHRKGRVPSPEATWMIAELLGFLGGIEACHMWLEDIDKDEIAINLLQPLSVNVEHHI